MSRTPVRLILATFLLLPAARADAVTFTARVIDASGPSRAWGKGAGDLNGDGHTDLVVGGYDGGLYWYQNPNWTKRTISATRRVEEDMTITDLDNDGREDVIAITFGGVTWFRNAGTGWPASTLVSGLDLHDIVVTDLDNDGKRDIAARNQGATGNVLYLWRQIGLTSWAPTRISLPEGGEGLDQRDLDRDGKRDLIIGKYWFKNTSQRGELSFTRHTYNTDAAQNAFVAIGNLNGDDRLDIVTTPAEPNNGRYRISWFEAPVNRTGPWAEHVIQTNVETVHHFVGIADFDLDGDFDVATALTHLGDNPKIKLFLNLDGRGSFSSPQIIANTSSHSMKLVRVKGDRGTSLFGADYGIRGPTPVRLFRWREN